MRLLAMFLTGCIFYFLFPFWWSVALSAFSTAFVVYKTARSAFWSGFITSTLLWTIMILVKTIPNDNLLAQKMAGLIHFSDWSLLLFLSAMLGGLVSGFGALSGYLTGQVMMPYIRKFIK